MSSLAAHFIDQIKKHQRARTKQSHTPQIDGSGAATRIRPQGLVREPFWGLLASVVDVAVLKKVTVLDRSALGFHREYCGTWSILSDCTLPRVAGLLRTAPQQLAGSNVVEDTGYCRLNNCQYSVEACWRHMKASQSRNRSTCKCLSETSTNTPDVGRQPIRRGLRGPEVQAK